MRGPKWVGSLVVAAGTAAIVVLTAAPADAATSPVRFAGIQYNAPGSDTSRNVNGEYVKITNYGGKAVTITRWTVRDKAGHTYRFPRYTIKAHDSLWLRSGKGTHSHRTFYWGSGWHIWNNTGDTATLRNASGTWKDSCSWSGSTSSGWKTC